MLAIWIWMLVGRVVGRVFLFTVLIFQGMCICRFRALLTVVRGFERLSDVNVGIVLVLFCLWRFSEWIENDHPLSLYNKGIHFNGLSWLRI
jgi:hypothetical protein